MKNIIIGFIVASLLITGGVAFYRSGNATEKETASLTSDAANAIAYAWNPEELTRRAEPGLIKAMQAQGQSVEQLFEIYGKLGKPKAPLVCAYKDSADFSNYTTASYVCSAEFESGPATMDITLRKPEEGNWKIYHIRVNSALF